MDVIQPVSRRNGRILRPLGAEMGDPAIHPSKPEEAEMEPDNLSEFCVRPPNSPHGGADSLRTGEKGQQHLSQPLHQLQGHRFHGGAHSLAEYSGEDRVMSVGFQQTEIGEFPSTWEIDRVDSAFEIQQGKQVSKKNREGDNQRPFLRTKNVFWNRLELSELDQMNFTVTEEARLELRASDLLVCEGGSIGRTALWNEGVDGCLYQNHLHRLRVKDEKAEPQFGLYWFWYAFDVAKLYFGRGNVTTIPNLSRSKLAELPMALPPLPCRVWKGVIP